MAPRLSARRAAEWETERALLAEIAPDLRLELPPDVEQARIVGSLSVPRPGGRTAAFDIEIDYPGLDPRQLPSTRDAGGRFPPDPERHVETTGRFCLWVPGAAPAEEFAAPHGLAVYLCRLQEFLTLQLMYEARRRHHVDPHWPGDAWGHGASGQTEWLRETVAQLTADGLDSLLQSLRRPGNAGSRCPCGSESRFGACHQQWLHQVRVQPGLRDAAQQILKERRGATVPTSPTG